MGTATRPYDPFAPAAGASVATASDSASQATTAPDPAIVEQPVVEPNPEATPDATTAPEGDGSGVEEELPTDEDMRTVDNAVEWIGGDPERARIVRDLEGDDGRKTLLAYIAGVIDPESPSIG